MLWGGGGHQSHLDVDSSVVGGRSHSGFGPFNDGVCIKNGAMGSLGGECIGSALELLKILKNGFRQRFGVLKKCFRALKNCFRMLRSA